MNIKKGDKLIIHCYKHDGSLEHVSEGAIVLENNDEMLVCGNSRTRITEKDGRSYMTNEPAVLFFYKKSWFNIIAQLKKFGLFYYCNIATPYLIDDGIIKYIDYDLDLRVFPDGGFKILDKNEYKYHKKIMHYSKETDMIVKRELNELIKMKKDNKGPFNKEKVKEYYDLYKKITENV